MRKKTSKNKQTKKQRFVLEILVAILGSCCVVLKHKYEIEEHGNHYICRIILLLYEIISMLLIFLS